MIEKIGGRKFLFAILVAVGLFVLAILEKISYSQLVSGLLWALGIFSTTNSVQKFAPLIKGLLKK